MPFKAFLSRLPTTGVAARAIVVPFAVFAIVTVLAVVMITIVIAVVIIMRTVVGTVVAVVLLLHPDLLLRRDGVIRLYHVFRLIPIPVPVPVLVLIPIVIPDLVICGDRGAHIIIRARHVLDDVAAVVGRGRPPARGPLGKTCFCVP